MAKIDNFRERWEGLGEESQLVDTLDKSSERDFEENWGDFIGYLQAEHKNMTQRTVGALPANDIGAQLTFAKQYFENSRNNTLKYGKKNIEDIVNDIDDPIPFIINILPIRNIDIRNKKAYDLDRLAQDYEDKANTLKSNLIPITPNSTDAQKQRHNVQERAIKKYEEFSSLLRDKENRELVKNILGYREQVSYLGGEDRRPNTEKMKELYFAYLNDILNEFGNDKAKFADNIGVIGTLKYLATKNSEFLTGQYAERILEPAKEKLQTVIENNDIGKYVGRILEVKNPREQMQIFEKLHEVAGEEFAKKKKENKLLEETYNYNLKGYKRTA